MHVDFRSVDDFADSLSEMADSNRHLMLLLSESHQDRLEAPIAAQDPSGIRNLGGVCPALNAGRAFGTKVTSVDYPEPATRRSAARGITPQ